MPGAGYQLGYVLHKWRSTHGGIDVSLMARMKELEAEIARLRKIIANSN